MSTPDTKVYADRIRAHNLKVTSREIVETIIDFYVSLEPTSPADLVDDTRYDSDLATYSDVIVTARDILRRHAKQLRPQSLERMKQEYYSFLNSTKYSRDRVSYSVAGTILNHAWDGIAGWRS